MTGEMHTTVAARPSPRLAGRVGLNSIQGRLTVIAFVFIVGTAVSMGVVGFRFTVNFEQERFQDHFNLLASYFASNAELGVLLGNEQILQGLTGNMLTVKDVQVVEIVDRTGKRIIRMAQDGPLPELGYVSAPVVSRTIVAAEDPFLETGPAEEELGRVTIGYSSTGLELLKKRLAVGFISLSMLLAVVPVLFYWRLSRAVRAPLQGVLHVAEQVTGGRLDVRAEGGPLIETQTLAAAFNEMLDALQLQRQQLKKANEVVARQQVLAEVGKFSMTVAHEIKNPLAIIKGSLGVLRKDEPIAAELRGRMFGFVDEEIVRIDRLIEDFLLFARPRPPAFQVMSVALLVDRLKQRIGLMASQARVVLDLGDADGQRLLHCDLFLFERALLNVLRNALEAAGRGEGVEVRIACAPEQLVFTVLDDGPGIDPALLVEIFEPFFSRKSKGTGLGLAITRDAINAHGGQVVASNRESGGASFHLTLPLLDTAAKESAENDGAGCGALCLIKEKS